MILFEHIFLIHNNDTYTETYQCNETMVTYNVQARFINVSESKITTKCENGYCPPAMIDEIINYGKTIMIETRNLDRYVIAKADVTFMIKSHNLLIDIDTASNSPNMINGVFASFI